jgi:hypothetical protein
VPVPEVVQGLTPADLAPTAAGADSHMVGAWHAGMCCMACSVHSAEAAADTGRGEPSCSSTHHCPPSHIFRSRHAQCIVMYHISHGGTRATGPLLARHSGLPRTRCALACAEGAAACVQARVVCGLIYVAFGALDAAHNAVTPLCWGAPTEYAGVRKKALQPAPAHVKFEVCHWQLQPPGIWAQ